MSAAVAIRDPLKARLYPFDRDFERGCGALGALLGERAPAVIERSALVIFTPGCLVAGQLDQGLELLARGGFAPVFGRYFRFDEALVTRMWRYQLPTFRPDRWRLIVDLLLAGASFLLLARDDAPLPPDSAATRARALKGPSDPLLGQPGQLRTDLGGMNKIINLVHSAEEEADVVRETALLFDELDFRAAWSAAAAGSIAAGAAWWSLAAPGVRPGGVSFVHAAAPLRRRLAEAIAAREADGAVARSLASAPRGEIEWLRQADSRRPLAALDEYRRRFAGHRLAPPEHRAAAPATDVVAGLLEAALVELEHALFEEPCDLERLWCACAQAGFHVDGWDRLIISTQCVTADLRARAAAP